MVLRSGPSLFSHFDSYGALNGQQVRNERALSYRLSAFAYESRVNECTVLEDDVVLTYDADIRQDIAIDLGDEELRHAEPLT